jgi:Rieske Fe-S protein
MPNLLRQRHTEEANMKRKDHDKSRRAFLRNAAATGIAAGAAAASVDAVAEIVPDAEEPEQKNGYRLTDHVQAYYKSFNR